MRFSCSYGRIELSSIGEGYFWLRFGEESSVGDWIDYGVFPRIQLLLLSFSSTSPSVYSLSLRIVKNCLAEVSRLNELIDEWKDHGVCNIPLVIPYSIVASHYGIISWFPLADTIPIVIYECLPLSFSDLFHIVGGGIFHLLSLKLYSYSASLVAVELLFSSE